MSSASDGVAVMPDFSAHTFSSAGDMKFQLQNLLDSKEKQLQQAGTLGQRVLAQQMELEERIRQLQEMDVDKGEDDEIDAEARERYRELAETIRAWDAENVQLSSAFATKRLVNGNQPSPALPLADLPREEPERSKASLGTSAAQSRRAKNAAHRADDVEFAFEIGSGLLTEVRRLQSLLGERDKAIQDMKEEKDDLEKTVESLRTALRSQEQSADKFKEENWNLEVTLQELRTQLSDSQASTLRLEGEHKRLTKLLASSREATDTHKNESERLKVSLDELKAKHETDVALARKHAAGLQRDKSDLQTTLDGLKKEVERAGRRLPRFGSPLTPDGRVNHDYLTPAVADDDVFTATGGASTNRRKHDDSALFPDGFASVDSSPDPSPSKPFLASSHPSNEIEALQQRLAHTQRTINTLKGTLQREKELRMEYRRKLESSPGGFEDDGGEVRLAYDEEEPELPKARPRFTPYRSSGKTRGRGRGRGGLTLVQRLALAPNSPTVDYLDEADYEDLDTIPPVPSIPIKLQDADFGDDVYEVPEGLGEQVPHSPSPRSPSPLEVPSNRTSVDGMDPAFANVLRRSPSIPQNGSPLRHSYSRGVTRRSRGGAAYHDGRPPSLVDNPEALDPELWGGMAPVEEIPPKEMSEIGCQTDFEDITVLPLSPPPPPPPVLHVTPATSDASVQADPEPEPEPESVPVIIRSEMSCQTDDPPVIAYIETATQHDAIIDPAPALVSTSMNTEPEIVILPEMVQAEVQASVYTLDVDTQTPPSPAVSKSYVDTHTQSIGEVEDENLEPEANRRTTITQYNLSQSLGDNSGDTTITRVPRRFFTEGGEDRDTDDDNETETETGAETETDLDDYHDARQSIVVTPSSQSFHSLLTVTDNDLSETDDDDVESIKASRMPSRQSAISMTSSVRRRVPSYTRVVPTVSYESKAISAENLEEKTPKPELKEMSIQTDEWIPAPAPAPVSAPVPTSPTGFGLYRVGSTGQQFQFISPPPSAGPTTPSLPVTAIPVSSSIRDSVASAVRPRTSYSDRRQSIESTISSVIEDVAPRSRVPSSVPSTVDKSRPPMMVLPPPPRQPPPPSSMPPPSFIPERRLPTSSHDVPPPRPSSPPPAELLQRATTPTFGSVLSVPGGRGTYPRQHGSSMPPSQQGLRQLPSTSSFRSAANAAAHAQQSLSGVALSSFSVREKERREMSSTSLISERSMASPRSSMSSDHHMFVNRAQPATASPATPQRPGDVSGKSGGSTDPNVIHAITQTMIGEFLYKYTRRTIGKGYGQSRHKRFFWVHPYTKTLYWSSADPGSSNVSESSAKSAYIEGVRSVLDPNPMPPGLYQYSVIVSTPQREMKITAPTKDRHDIWLNALRFLLSRPDGVGVASPGNATATPGPTSPMSMRGEFLEEENHHLLQSSPQSQRSGRSTRKESSWNTTPRGQRSRSQLSVGGSLGKRSGTPAAEYLRWNGPESPYSPTKSFEHVPSQDDEELDFELHGDSFSDEGFEGLENVRACCDGRHTVGGHHHHHHHHQHQHHGHPPNGDKHLDARDPGARPASPSAWSLRSRTGSQNSHEGNNLFSWGRGEDGKLRFGSWRSTKTVPGVTAGAHDQ